VTVYDLPEDQEGNLVLKSTYAHACDMTLVVLYVLHALHTCAGPV